MKNFKIRDLKVYASDDKLAGDERNYRLIFEQDEVTYIWAELSLFNKLFDTRNWHLDCRILAFDKENKLVCNVDAGQDVSSQDAIKYVRVKWGSDTPGAVFKRGGYRWEAWVDGDLVCQKVFHIVDQGSVVPGNNPYFAIRALRLFEGGSLLSPPTTRTYGTEFPAETTRYVWLEMKATNLLKASGQNWPLEFIVNLFNRNNHLKGRISRLMFVDQKQEHFELVLGWGAETPGNWFPGEYRFDVEFLGRILTGVTFAITQSGTDLPWDPVTCSMEVPTKEREAPTAKPAEVSEALGELNELIGLEAIKTRIRDFVQFLQFVSLRREKGFPDTEKINLHAIYTGNPGTGKTVVAKQMGRIYQKIGLLPKGHLVQADRSDLVGEYIGHTAPRTRAMIQKAMGGVLFIDEAYSLLRSNDDGRDFGREAIEILLKQMSEHEGEFAVILAGYPREMDKFMNCNPGLKSRFEMHFEFPDYTPQELLQIAELAAHKRSVVYSSGARESLYRKLVAAYRDRNQAFGNARFAISLVEESKINMALRLMAMPNPKILGREALATIEGPDVDKIHDKRKGKAPDIPIDEGLLKDTLDQLQAMVGLETVKHEIAELVKLVRYYREIGKDIRRVFSLHSVFTGNPGTGKTTVARLMANIYKALGILERGHLVECERQRLVAGYVGQTGEKTNRLIDTAMGGVLFIDEAYALARRGADDFGMETIETLMKRMDEDRGLFVVIVSGYVQNMSHFLESNPGLKSRFDRVLRFEDYSAPELFEIALFLFEKEGMSLADGVAGHLQAYFQSLHAAGDPNLGNARIVRRICERAIRNHDLRLAAMDPKDRTSEKAATLTLEDVSELCIDDIPIKTSDRIGFR